MNLETLFTTEAGFNVQDATPLQRAICRVAQGESVGDLASHPDVIAGFGGAEAVASLPVGCVPAEMHLPGPSRSGKSKILAADALVAGQRVTFAGSDLGDIVRVSVLGLTTRTNAIWSHLAERVSNQPKLRRLLIGDVKDTVFALRHPSGRAVEYMLVPIDKWGGSVISVFSAGIYIDEESRQIGVEDGVKNWDGVHDASAGRLLPGAKFFGCGAPWAPRGPVYDLVQERFGKPGPDMVIIRGHGPTWNPSWWTPARCADLERRNPTAYRSDVLAEFIDQISGLLPAPTIQATTRDEPLEIPPEDCRSLRAAGLDPSEAGAGNAFSLVIVDAEKRKDNTMHRRVVFAREWRHCGVETAIREAATHCFRYGIKKARSDKYAGAANVALARRYGLTIEAKSSTTVETVDGYTNLATYLATGTLELAPEPTLLRDLIGIRKIATANGFRIELPHTTDGRHADFAPALIAALAVVDVPDMREKYEQLSRCGRYLTYQMEGDPSVLHPDDRRAILGQPDEAQAVVARRFIRTVGDG